MNYRCPACGTGRVHAVGCREVPEAERGQMYDEAKRDPLIAVETIRLMEEARRLCGQPPLSEKERAALRPVGNNPSQQGPA